MNTSKQNIPVFPWIFVQVKNIISHSGDAIIHTLNVDENKNCVSDSTCKPVILIFASLTCRYPVVYKIYNQVE